MMIKYYKLWFFYIWEAFCIYTLWKLWYLYLALILYLFASVIWLLIKKSPQIVFTDKKLNLFINYFKLNLLFAAQHSHINKKFISTWLGFYLFRIVVGVSYKLIRMSISLFDCFYREYQWGDLGRKKKNKKIIKKYLSRSLENFIFLEFIKQTPPLEKEMVFRFKYFEKNIKIIIKNNSEK